MAKDQNLSLNPTKISGVCGRLMCCLNYEADLYKKGGDLYVKKERPQAPQEVAPPGIGKEVVTDEGDVYKRQVLKCAAASVMLT